MSKTKPILLWIRRDLRLSDHAALACAVESGAPIIPVFVRDASVDGLGAAPKWRLGTGLKVFAKTLEDHGSRLIYRTGDALQVLRDLIDETGAGAVFWQRLYDPDAVERDSRVKTALKEQGCEARSFGGHLMFEPWTVETQSGGMYRVYTPFWRNVKDRDVAPPRPAPDKLTAPETWPDSEALGDWHLDRAMQRGADVVARHARVGAQAAQDRLGSFIDDWVATYGDNRNIPSVPGTSGLSENLSLGEISPHQCWHAGMRALHEGKPGAEIFLKELVWREFAYHLMHHSPELLTRNWKSDWDSFAWNDDASHPDVIAWKQGRTGIEFVDAAMREMYVTGKMHNRARMIAASYLTKHLMTHWRIGQKWFEDCLTDWDPASNAMGWQWVAGSGPDASPYFRVFTPDTQREKFDKSGAYLDAWIAEARDAPSETALSYFDAVPKAWGLSPHDAYPDPVVALDTGRKRALNAYDGRDF